VRNEETHKRTKFGEERKRNSLLGLRNKRYVNCNDLYRLFNNITENKVILGILPCPFLQKYMIDTNFGSCFYFCLQVFGRYYLKYNMKYKIQNIYSTSDCIIHIFYIIF